MKFTCNQQTLAKALNTVSKAVSNRTTIPILKGIQICAEESGKLTLTASDLEISIKKEIEADVTEPGAFVVMAKLFGDIIRKLPNEDILISEESEGSVLIKTSYSEFNVVSFPIDEFPEIGNREEDSESLVFDRNLLKEMIRKVGIYAVMVLVAAVIAGVGVPGFAEEVYGATTTYQDDDIRELGDPGVRRALRSRDRIRA